MTKPTNTSLREAIAETMMNGWLESMNSGSINIDGGESTITKSYINPTVLDRLEALLTAKTVEAERFGRYDELKNLATWAYQQHEDKNYPTKIEGHIEARKFELRGIKIGEYKKLKPEKENT